MKTRNLKFLLMFVLMLSIVSANADAQRRRSRSRTRTRTTQTQRLSSSAPRLNPSYNECKQMCRNGDDRFYTDLLHLDPHGPKSQATLRKIFKAGNNWNAVCLWAELTNYDRKTLPFWIETTSSDGKWVILEYNDGNNQRYKVNWYKLESWWNGYNYEDVHLYIWNTHGITPPSYIYVTNGWISKVIWPSL